MQREETPLLGFMEVAANGVECSVCLSGDKELMQLSCAHVMCVTCFVRRVASGSPHSGEGNHIRCCVCTRVEPVESIVGLEPTIDNDWDVGASCKEPAETNDGEEEDGEGEEEPDLAIHYEPLVVELESRVQGRGANIVVVGQTGSGKSRLLPLLDPRKRGGRLRHVDALQDPKSKITLWDSRGIPSWSRSGVEQLTESITQLESASVGVDFVIVTVSNDQLMKGAQARLGRFLGWLNALGKNAGVAVMPSSGQSVGVGPNLVRTLAKMGAVHQLSPTVSQLTMANGGTICLLTSSAESGTSDGSVSSFGTTDLLMCILNMLPRHAEKLQNAQGAAGLRAGSTTPMSAITLLVGWAGATVAVMKLLHAF